jgi:hypothetical protein
MEHAFERQEELNATKAEEAMVEEAEVEAAAAGGASEVHTIPPYSEETTCSEVSCN